jgi:hypothetical protein
MNALTGNAHRMRFYTFPVRETLSIEKRVSPLFSSPEGNHIHGKEMNALTGNAQNHVTCGIGNR